VRKNSLEIRPRDYEILMFLWMWKAAPLSVLQHRYFQKTHLRRAYHRLNQLERGGYVEQRLLMERNILPGKSTIRLWTLAKRGFQVIQDALPELKEEGFRSEHPVHDWLVSSLHNGNYLGAVPEEVKICTEQQLRRIEDDALPDWVPRNTYHRPDGYWGIAEGNTLKTFAIEVELHAKKESDYQMIGEFYAIYPQITQVFWLVPTKNFAEKIQRAINKCHQTRTRIHSFMLLNQFKLMGWKAPIIFGPDCSKTLDQLLPEPLRPKGVQVPCIWTGLLWMKSSVSTAFSTVSEEIQKPPDFN
jgi:hypothetical protein